MTKKSRVSTFNKILSLEEAEREKAKGTEIGKSLKRADDLYLKQRRKK